MAQTIMKDDMSEAKMLSWECMGGRWKEVSFVDDFEIVMIRTEEPVDREELGGPL